MHQWQFIESLLDLTWKTCGLNKGCMYLFMDIPEYIDDHDAVGIILMGGEL